MIQRVRDDCPTISAVFLSETQQTRSCSQIQWLGARHSNPRVVLRVSQVSRSLESPPHLRAGEVAGKFSPSASSGEQASPPLFFVCACTRYGRNRTINVSTRTFVSFISPRSSAFQPNQDKPILVPPVRRIIPSTCRQARFTSVTGAGDQFLPLKCASPSNKRLPYVVCARSAWRCSTLCCLPTLLFSARNVFTMIFTSSEDLEETSVALDPWLCVGLVSTFALPRFGRALQERGTVALATSCST